MRFDLVTCAVVLAGTASATWPPGPSWRPDPTFGTDVLAGFGMIQLAVSQLMSGAGNNQCSLRNAVIRKEWYVSPHTMPCYDRSIG